MSLEPGTVFQDKYRIVRRVGKGGMGSVYEAENMQLKRQVAIKLLHADVSHNTEFVARFEREATAAGRIGSEHIVEVLDIGATEDGQRYMILEYLEGEDARRRIKRKGRLGGLEIAHILHQVLVGLSAAHQAGVVHRDMKPDNIFLLKNRAGMRDFVKLLDFGVSKFAGLDQNMEITKAGAIMGTPYYMSPEAAKGDPVDHRSDIYAVGVIMYQMLAGRRPFEGKNFSQLLFRIALEPAPQLAEVAPDCPPALVDIVCKAMHREPEQRYQSCDQFRQDLEAWVRTQAAEDGTIPSYENNGPYSGRNRLSYSGIGTDSWNSWNSWGSGSDGPPDSSRSFPSSISVSDISIQSAAGIPASTRAMKRSTTLRSLPDSVRSPQGMSVSHHDGKSQKGKALLVVLICALIGVVTGVGVFLFNSPRQGDAATAAGQSSSSGSAASAESAGVAPVDPPPAASSSVVTPSPSASEAPSVAPSASASTSASTTKPPVAARRRRRAAPPPPVRPQPPAGGCPPGTKMVGGRCMRTGL